jgi:tetratricopeptide (TPR) repeat protein
MPAAVWGETDQETAAMFRQQGQEAQGSGNFKQALFYYIRAVAFQPDDAGLQNDLGLMYEQNGKLDYAETAYYEAIQLDSHYLPAYSNIAELYKKRGNYELAAMYFKRRVELGGVSDPWMLRAQEELEDVYRLAPELKNTRTLEEAAKMEAQLARERLLARRESKRQKALGYDIAFLRGLTQYKAGEYDESQASFEEALKFRPESKDAQHALERAKLKHKDLEVDSTMDATLKENRDLIINKYVTEEQYQAEAGQP